MTSAKKDLWLRLQAYRFEHLVPPGLLDYVTEMFGGTDAATKAFASKLARKLGWTVEFALEAIAEYKKFVFLGVTSEISVTPSRIIDQVWHEHVLFTQAYPRFCEEILRVPFHHNPELVPQDDQTAVFQVQYFATLELYRREFHATPPENIWATPKFDREAVTAGASEPRRKREDDPTTIYSSDNTPLFVHVGGDDATSGGDLFAGFTGGESGGGGAGASWSESSEGGSSGDSGGGSSCSSSCGGGGGGD